MHYKSIVLLSLLSISINLHAINLPWLITLKPVLSRVSYVTGICGALLAKTTANMGSYVKEHKVMCGAVATSATALMAMPQVRNAVVNYIKRWFMPVNHAIVHLANANVVEAKSARDSVALEGKQLTLHDAVRTGDVTYVRKLIEAREDINAQVEQETPLSLAVLFGHKEIVQLLLDAGALIDEDQEARLLMLAERYANRFDIFLLLAERMGRRFSELDMAILHNQIVIVQELSDGKYYTDYQGINAIYSHLDLAALSGNPEIISTVIARSPKDDINRENRLLHRCPIHFAVAMRRLDAVHALARAGANLNVYSRYLTGGTPLSHALATKNQPMVDLLTKLGAKA